MNEAKMNLTIKGATDSELSSIEYRLRRESEIQELIKRIRRNSKSINYGSDQGRDQVEEGVPLSTPINELYHHGIKGMKWGVRRYQNPDGTLTSSGRKRYQPTSSDSSTTKKVKKDLASLSESEFRNKYATSKRTYMKRVDRYGDPYMKAPLAKLGKKMDEKQRIKRGKAKVESIIEKFGDQYPVTIDEKGIVTIKVGDDIWKVGY